MEKSEVYHFHSPELLPVGIILKLTTRAKVIYDVHEDFPKDFLMKEWIPTLLRKPISLTFAILERLACRVFDNVIAATGPIASHLPAEKTVVITNYPLLKITGNRSAERYGQKDRYTLLYAGFMSEERGIYELVRSLDYVDEKVDFCLRLVGRIEPADFYRKIRSLKGFSRVNLTEWVPYEEIIKCLKESDVGVVVFRPSPNQFESMPNKLFEYMAVGLPIIASNFPLWKEVVEGNKCGLTVNPLDPQDIARAIEYLLKNPKERKQMGINGRRAVIEKYNWDTEKTKLLKLYSHLFRSDERYNRSRDNVMRELNGNDKCRYS